jgi:hypothetical protein
MINKFKLILGSFDRPERFTFQFISQLGSCKVEVMLQDVDKEKRNKVFVSEYYVLNEQYDSTNTTHVEAIKRIANELDDEMCQGNNWVLWSY